MLAIALLINTLALDLKAQNRPESFRGKTLEWQTFNTAAGDIEVPGVSESGSVGATGPIAY